jgi:hypothetical protein
MPLQSGRCLSKFSSDLMRCGQVANKMRHPHLRPDSAEAVQTTADKRYSPSHIAIFDFAPALIDRGARTPVGEALLANDRGHLVYPLAEDCIASVKRKQLDPQSKSRCQRRGMSKPPALGNRCANGKRRI